MYNLDSAEKEDEKFDDFPFMMNFFNLSFKASVIVINKIFSTFEDHDGSNL